MATRPPAGTVEAWAYDYVTSADLGHKLAPPPPPKIWQQNPPELRLLSPGRPRELQQEARVRPPRSLQSPRARAKLLHTFFHHELQAAELMCWALLAFADTDLAFRRGLLKICLDEVRHMRMYQQHIEKLGFQIGTFPTRDWFWKRVPSCTQPLQFVAMMGMGLEAANLEHAQDFAQRFKAAGDGEGAQVQLRVGKEEIPHVKFAVSWFRRFAARSGKRVTFKDWCSALPEPLTPLMMRGLPLNRDARSQAGMSEEFLVELERWAEATPHS
ncbi:MAG TPA: DUF455 family protein [Polyangiaceae bacterium]|nr:DUF455 family protein [Polyangiaceae bacterium]